MSPFSIAILAFSMSADAFAAAVARGATQRPMLLGAAQAGVLFGVIEGFNIFAGWCLGIAASAFIQAVDHWVAFILLGGVGAKMIHAGLSGESHEDELSMVAPNGRTIGLVATAVGTSIDSAAVGISLAFLDADIVMITAAVALATFSLATLGMMIGRVAGARFGSYVEVGAGVALIALGTKILLEHLELLG